MKIDIEIYFEKNFTWIENLMNKINLKDQIFNKLT